MARRRFHSLRIKHPDHLEYGVAPEPVVAGTDVKIGGGIVYPEINFTLPAISVEEQNWERIVSQYRRMIGSLVTRAVALEAPGLVVEFEQLPAMTETPAWGAEITGLLRDELGNAAEKRGLKSALRVTIVDLRDTNRPPKLRGGKEWESMIESWRLSARAGADLLSIESVGGKEVHDAALMVGDVAGIVYALGVLAARDMEWLWGELVSAAEAEGKIAAGDSACGFANTAMQLAHQKMLPEALAAVVRAMGAPRSLIAMECGAKGPSKDCAYEGPVLKMIAGCPISMEGKSAACAHLSPVGNIAGMAADLWSNESVQNVRLLSADAPEVFLEILAYDCRLMNCAGNNGSRKMLRDLMVDSDVNTSPQAFVLSPDATLQLSETVVRHSEDDYRRTLEAGRTAFRMISEAVANGVLTLGKSEMRWMGRIGGELSELPDTAEELEARVMPQYGHLIDGASYGLD